MSNFKRYAIEIIIILYLTIGYMSSDLKTNDKASVNIQGKQFSTTELTILKYLGSNNFTISDRIGNASNIRAIQNRQNIDISCATGYSLLGTFPKLKNYTKYKCTKEPCIAEGMTAYVNGNKIELESERSTTLKIVQLSNYYRFYVKEKNSVTNVSTVICVPTEQLGNWKNDSWF